jgi:ribonuclease HI
MNPPKKGIVVDGATKGNPGPSEYRGIDLETGELLFHQKLGIATNNIAEFCALGHAILYASDKGFKITIYSDSQTAISWIRKKKVNSKLPDNPKTQKAIDYVCRIESALNQVIGEIKSDGIDLYVKGNAEIIVSKWYSSEYGEIPADFGNKK